ncbi:MAG: SAM-dependent methyltransferase [Acidobacteriota bacterium]|nr:SAM-dependent methyltransferase [Acidobacteriota bacterium]
MCGGELNEVIRAEISVRGSVSFCRFMDLALYHPALGYYRRGSDPFGIRGDFYTAEQLPAFGQILAIYVAKLKSTLEKTANFEILELGAGRGELAQALRPWNYRAFEWNTDPLPESMSGLVIANEFFDALPVHLLSKTQSGWRELGVTWDGQRFVFAQAENLSSELARFAEREGGAAPVGGLLEVNLAMRSWVERVGRFLVRGRLLVIDYGYATPELARFPMGTLMAYRGHAAHSEVLDAPGKQDITAHVNFSVLRATAVNSGFKIVRECSLRAWALSICETGEWIENWEAADARWRLHWKQLVFGMGETFRVLELEKAATK